MNEKQEVEDKEKDFSKMGKIFFWSVALGSISIMIALVNIYIGVILFHATILGLLIWGLSNKDKKETN